MTGATLLLLVFPFVRPDAWALSFLAVLPLRVLAWIWVATRDGPA